MTLLLALALAAWGQWRISTPDGLGRWWADAAAWVWLAGVVVAAVVVRRQVATQASDRPGETAGATVPPGDVTSPPFPPLSLALVVAGPLLGAAGLWFVVRTGAETPGRVEALVLWLAVMAALVIPLVTWQAVRPARVAAAIRSHRVELGVVATVTGAGLLLRVVRLDRFPWLFTGDEGAFARSALQVRADERISLLGTGWLGHPTLWPALEAAALRVVPDDVTAVRLPAALLGAATVLLLYALARQHFGRAVAVVAATLLAVSPLHLFLSRSALNNVTAPFAVVLALLLLPRAYGRAGGGSPAAAAGLGLAIGLAQYGYPGGRVIPGIVALGLTGLVLTDRPWRRWHVRSWCRGVATQGCLVLAGVLVSIAPLLAWYRRFPEQFAARSGQLDIFRNGWLDRERSETGRSPVEIVARLSWDGLTYPFLTDTTTHAVTFYRAGAPLLGWPAAVLGAVGLGAVMLGAGRRSLGLAAAFVVVAVALGITEPPVGLNRYAPLVALLPLIVAVGLVGTARCLAARRLGDRRLVAGVIVLVVAMIGVGSLRDAFDDDELTWRSADGNTLVAATFADEMAGCCPDATVYYAAAPRMTFRGHPNQPFLLPGVTATDVLEPWDPASAPPVLGPGTTVFFFLPERAAELATVRAWFPDGTLAERTGPDGQPLYLTWVVTR